MIADFILAIVDTIDRHLTRESLVCSTLITFWFHSGQAHSMAFMVITWISIVIVNRLADIAWRKILAQP